MPPIHTKRITERLLSGTYVNETYLARPADEVFFDLIAKYGKGVVVEMYWQQQFANPVIDGVYPGCLLRDVLEDICRFCRVHMTVTDDGHIRLAPPPKRLSDMSHRVEIEPDGNWKRVEKDGI